MSSTAYASDGGSSTESEDDIKYEQFDVKSEPKVDNSPEVVPFTDTPVVKSEAEIVESNVTNENLKEMKPELPVTDAIPTTNQAEQPSETSDLPPCCSACGYPLLVVSQTEILEATNTLDCKCCLLVLPESSYSKTQRGEGRKDIRKCIACTGNVRGAQRLVKPTREKPKKPKGQKPSNKEKRNQERHSVFVNKVARLKMAMRALQRKRDEVGKLKATKRREEYEQQLDREEQDLARQSALLKRGNPSRFKELMDELKIKKPPTYEQDKKKKAKKANSEKKPRSKRKADTVGEQAKKKKKKGPAVDSSVYDPPASAADDVPARIIPTRSRTRAQPQPDIIEVKSEVKAELPKVEPKME
ncbi:Hypothetical protein PHPALM_10529 [Phytophthora palmivora]|uniref:Uncharacterized protein n=1 Tax=Phytophthora palmivora TaxID=4796 RepID=A0A2P4Y4H1_9STRA|nr:Hypothetical protein PHPALM_10529 [Phytophthora palmivora]